MAREFAKAFYRSKEWRVVREYCLMRDKYLCTECGSPAEEVHHIIHLTPENIGNVAVSLNADNLKCLCKDCHFEAHKGEHGKGRKAIDGYGYEFDSMGNLVPKSIPPI